MSTVMASFNTTVRQMTKMSQRPKRLSEKKQIQSKMNKLDVPIWTFRLQFHGIVINSIPQAMLRFNSPVVYKLFLLPHQHPSKYHG